MTRPLELPPLEWLRERFAYEPDTGHLRYMMNAGQRRRAGSIAGSANNQGYWRVGFTYQGKFYQRQAHRIAWALHYGEDPASPLVIDHINRDRRDNRITNLRLVDAGVNNRNRDGINKSPDDPTGFSPVTISGKQRFQAQAKVNGRSVYLGLFKTKAAAAAAYTTFITGAKA